MSQNENKPSSLHVGAFVLKIIWPFSLGNGFGNVRRTDGSRKFTVAMLSLLDFSHAIKRKTVYTVLPVAFDQVVKLDLHTGNVNQ